MKTNTTLPILEIGKTGWLRCLVGGEARTSPEMATMLAYLTEVRPGT
jgi:hypothetical protein